MQSPEFIRDFNSSANNPNHHRHLKPENPFASSHSTLVEQTVSASYASSTFDVLPVFDASVIAPKRPWWETEAEDILRSTDFCVIQLLCRYRVFRDNSIPYLILQERWPLILDGFLLRLNAGKITRDIVIKLSLDQKVEEILKRLMPSHPAPDFSLCVSYSMLLESDASRIASKLNGESLSWFEKITFSDYVREALYPEKVVRSVKTFKDWHDLLFNEIFGYLKNFPQDVEKYTQIEQVSATAIIPPPLMTDTMVATAQRQSGALGRLSKLADATT